MVVDKVEQNLRFQGQYFDHEASLHYNMFRYYDPEMGRFIVQDPLGLMGDNLYRYGPNPILWIDPLGWMPLANPVKVGHHMVPHFLATSLGIPRSTHLITSLPCSGWSLGNGIEWSTAVCTVTMVWARVPSRP
ncbi:RHS repeat-associated core domain-containing protein [Pseudomonas putida]|uniref:RHS repeat-associated core domain-containing protein n=1 Tax=Pseudomonas putida TaxID=303 RepID=UPI004044ED95